MKSFKQFTLMDDKTISAVWDMVEFLDYVDNDGVVSLDENILSKLGLEFKKKDSGLIQDIAAAGKGFGKFLIAAFKGDTKTIKEMANKEITKEEVLSFLSKLDMATLHLFSTPIHTIEAITGWKLSVSKKPTGKLLDKIKSATDHIKTQVSAVKVAAAKKIIANVNRIEKLAQEV